MYIDLMRIYVELIVLWLSLLIWIGLNYMLSVTEYIAIVNNTYYERISPWIDILAEYIDY